MVDLSEGHNIFWRGDQFNTLILINPQRTPFDGQQVNDGTWTKYLGQGAGTLSVDPLLAI